MPSWYLQNTGPVSYTHLDVYKRQEEARKLLKTTSLHVNTIGQLVGYPDAAYFSKQFKQVMGMTAAACRREARGETGLEDSGVQEPGLKELRLKGIK